MIRKSNIVIMAAVSQKEAMKVCLNEQAHDEHQSKVSLKAFFYERIFADYR